MNAARRKQIAALVEEVVKLEGPLEGFGVDAQDLLDEEQEYFDNMPESLQNGEKGEIANAAIEQIQTAIDAFEAAKEALLEAMTALEEAAA